MKKVNYDINMAMSRFAKAMWGQLQLGVENEEFEALVDGVFNHGPTNVVK